MTQTALALSPHLDDAAFSCGGTLARLAAEGWRVVIATVFTASMPDPQGFALACQLDKGLGPEVDYMALRRDEDAAACRLLGAEPLWLPFPEAPHRGYGSAADLFGDPHGSDDIAAPLGDTLAALLKVEAPALLLAPQAIGGHVDHVQVTRAVTRLGAACPILWWTDFPYTIRRDTPHRPFAAEMAGLGEVVVELGPDADGRKLAACAAYISQVGYQFGGPAELAVRLSEAGGVELFRGTGELPVWPMPVRLH